jgi:hypothetical protein
MHVYSFKFTVFLTGDLLVFYKLLKINVFILEKVLINNLIKILSSTLRLGFPSNLYIPGFATKSLH